MFSRFFIERPVLSNVLALVMITFFHITLGEQVPKILALQRAESIILFAVQPVSAMAWVLRPFISLLYMFTNLVLRLIALECHGEEHAVHSHEELQLLVTQSALQFAMVERVMARLPTAVMPAMSWR